MAEAIFRTEHGWRRFSQPSTVLTALALSDVRAVLDQVDAAALEGKVAVGYVAYEASAAFDPALTTHCATTPLARFAIYDAWEDLGALPAPDNEAPELDWQPEIDAATYRDRVQRIRELIAAGDTYQVNFTLRLRADGAGDPYALFHRMNPCRRTKFSAYWVDDDLAICGASPELFFSLEGDQLTCRPMKGTAPRGRTTHEDATLAAQLRASEKNRAENLMILDMVRSDLGRIAEVGSVYASEVFRIERYATVHQMTSTASCRTHSSLSEIFAALFPAASMTGAPKPRTMEIISDLESSPRGIYSGCMGTVGPGRQARFGVAIRTAELDRAKSEWTYGVGGGIVWDSTAESEAAEWRTKAAIILEPPAPPFGLLETFRWTPDGGYWLLQGHLDRLADSAAYFDRELDVEVVRRALEAYAERLSEPRRVRLTISEPGDIEITDDVLPVWPARPKVAISPVPVPDDPLLFHKTDRRELYQRALAAHPGYDEVLLQNESGEITEGTFTNVAARIGDKLWTTPHAAGVVPGVLRAHMISEGELDIRVLTPADLLAADEVVLLNSVRGMSPPVELSP